MNRQIKWMIKERGVQYFYHFTPFVNLPNILRWGIVPKDKIKEKMRDREIGVYAQTDENRLEGRTDCICLSVSFPNYKMMYLKQKEYKQECCKESVEPLKPEDVPNFPIVMIEIDAESFCNVPNESIAFFHTNAAKGHSKNNPILDKEFLEHGSLKAAKQMFYEEGRSILIPSSYPTDPQAEVLFRGEIPPGCIRRCMVKDFNGWIIVHSFTQVEEIQIDDTFFKPRVDWAEWRKRG